MIDRRPWGAMEGVPEEDGGAAPAGSLAWRDRLCAGRRGAWCRAMRHLFSQTKRCHLLAEAATRSRARKSVDGRVIRGSWDERPHLLAEAATRSRARKSVDGRVVRGSRTKRLHLLAEAATSTKATSARRNAAGFWIPDYLGKPSPDRCVVRLAMSRSPPEGSIGHDHRPPAID